jgi:hypothetical protein
MATANLSVRPENIDGDPDADEFPNVPTMELLCQLPDLSHPVLSITASKQRLARVWRAKFTQDFGNQRPEDIYSQHLESDMSSLFWLFFLAYPQPAHVLLSFIEICYDIDSVLEHLWSREKTLAYWKAMDKFRYLVADEQVHSWRSHIQASMSNIDERPETVEMHYRDLRGAARVYPVYQLGYLEEQFSILTHNVDLPDRVLYRMRERAGFIRDCLEVIGKRFDPASNIVIASSESEGSYSTLYVGRRFISHTDTLKRRSSEAAILCTI